MENGPFSVFDARLARHEAELREIYGKLYHNEQSYAYFTGMLRRMWAERNESLRALDSPWTVHDDENTKPFTPNSGMSSNRLSRMLRLLR